MNIKRAGIYIILFIACVVTLPSCRVVYPNQMFRQKDYQYYDLAQKELDGYLIQPGDQFTLKVFARDGFKLIDIIGGTDREFSNVANTQNAFLFTVDKEGFVRLPVLGDFFVSGFTERTLELVLADKYAGLFVDPWVSVKVNNRRVFVFRDGQANIVPLSEVPISIIEVIARSGGLAGNAKAYKIKVIRGDIKHPEIHLVDLSTLEGIRKSDLTIQPNDIVLVENRRQYVTDVFRLITPYTGVATTILTIVILFRTRLGQ